MAVSHVSSPATATSQHATGGHQNAIRDCGINGNGRLTESSSDAPPSPYVTFTDDPAAVADIAAWNGEYLCLENAANEASLALRIARCALNRKRPPANAQAVYDAALIAARETGTARWNFEMAATTIVDSASPTDPASREAV